MLVLQLLADRSCPGVGRGRRLQMVPLARAGPGLSAVFRLCLSL